MKVDAKGKKKKQIKMQTEGKNSLLSNYINEGIYKYKQRIFALLLLDCLFQSATQKKQLSINIVLCMFYCVQNCLIFFYKLLSL